MTMKTQVNPMTVDDKGFRWGQAITSRARLD